jgi:riboflavin synthase
MFTGLIQNIATVIANTTNNGANRLSIESPYADLELGESIAVNGVCLTLISTTQQLMFDISLETLSLTTLGQLRSGQQVNLERAMGNTSRFGGHYVSGHIDMTSCLISTVRVGDYLELTVGNFAPTAKAYLLPKGSITLNGVSLTINAVNIKDNDITIKLLLVPHTLANTTFKTLTIGDYINIEFDYLTRIVAHQVAHQLAILGPLKSEVYV